MKQIVKWTAIALAALIAIIIIAIIVAPMVISFDKYKPRIEAEASKALGRPVTLGGPISPSVFPWVGISLANVHLGNPTGFSEKDFVSVGLFEVRVRLLPLLLSMFKEVEIKRFVIKDPRIVLEKNKDGKSNLEGLGKTAKAAEATAAKPQAPATGGSGLPIKSFQAKEFAITNAQLLVIDAVAHTRHEIKDINLVLTDLSLDKPVGLRFSVLADGKPITITGKVGPVGPEPGKSPVNLDLVAELLQQMKIEIQGRVENPADKPAFSMQLNIPAFSARKVLAALNQPLPMEPADPKVLNAIALAMKISGTPEAVALSDGQLTLDDSKMTFQAQAKEFDKPNLKLKADLDQIDVDRYLPPPAPKKAEEAAAPTPTPAPEQKKKTDYTPLRKLILDAQIKVGALKAKNVRMQNVVVKATASNGIFHLDPMSVDLYKGQIATTGTFDVQQDQPRTAVNLSVNGVQAGPLLKDFLNKDLIEGDASASINLKFEGDQPDLIKKTLDGKGEITFKDGAFVGIDLANMVRNVESAFGLAEKSAQKPRTDFAELVAPFSINKGVTTLENARLNSPLLRVLTSGTADLVQEALNIRVEPKFVATLVGQGDTQQRSGLMVPIIVSGTFSKPTFKPDLKSMLTQQLPNAEELKKMVPDQKSIEKMVPPKEDIQKDLEQKGQELLKGLPFGQQKQ
ncbi:MAG: AsmA family protein [Desulfobacteraceae bacterium]|nr:AsmA family protein [Desulfobacteraceae bacterium]